MVYFSCVYFLWWYKSKVSLEKCSSYYFSTSFTQFSEDFILPELWDFKTTVLSLQPEKYLRFRSQVNGLNWNTTLMRNETYKKFIFEDFPLFILSTNVTSFSHWLNLHDHLFNNAGIRKDPLWDPNLYIITDSHTHTHTYTFLRLGLYCFSI